MTKHQFVKHIVELGYYKIIDYPDYIDTYYICVPSYMPEYEHIDLEINFKNNNYKIYFWVDDDNYTIIERKKFKNYKQLIDIIGKYELFQENKKRGMRLKELIK
jgi:hypothetical protein